MTSHDSGFLNQLFESVSKRQEGVVAARKPKPSYPKGWEPRVEETASEAFAVSKAFREPTEDEVSLIEGWNLDPNIWDIVPGSLVANRWEGQSGDGGTVWMYQYKARLRHRDHCTTADLQDLIDLIDSFDPAPYPSSWTGGADSFVVCLADWQIGKGPENTGGSGVEKTIMAIKQMIADVEARVRELRLIGRPLGRLYIAGMGDLIEQCSGNYSTQSFQVEINHRDQMKVTVRLLLEAIKSWSVLFDDVVVVAVGGNHGEHRQNGKKFTDDADNDDVAVFETVALVLAENPDVFGHVKFVIPHEDLVQVLDISGTLVAFTHGHLKGGKGGTLPQAGQWSWWKDQMGGELPAGDASVLVTGHFHHFSVIDHGPKLHLQCPAMDCGSKWFKDLAGKDSKRGTLTFTVSENGVDDIKVV